MTATMPIIPSQSETVAELRDLYRAAEARAARLRLLYEAGRDLGAARSETLGQVLDDCARRLAHFIGYPHGTVHLTSVPAHGLAIEAPGEEPRQVAVLEVPGFGTLDAIRDREDREAVRMQLLLMGAAIDRFARDAERARLLADLQERERRLEDLVARLFSAQEEERRRVSHELHDGVAQKATALFRLLESGAEEQSRLAPIARELVQELRGVIAGLRPTILDDLGLQAALGTLAANLRAEGYDVAESIDGGRDRWPVNLENAFYRVAQEALVNVRKHAGGPCRVELELGAQPKEGRWMLHVRDFGQGTGISPTEAYRGEHIGIAVMRERMAAVGGRLHWSARPGGGVEIAAVVTPAP